LIDYRQRLNDIGEDPDVVRHAVAFAEAITRYDWIEAARHIGAAEVVRARIVNVVAREAKKNWRLDR
jgi:hypothetical protein